MGEAATGLNLKYATGGAGVTAGTAQRFIIRRGARHWSEKIWVIMWGVMNAGMALVTIPAFLATNNLAGLVLVMNYLLLWLVLNVIGFIIIHYTNGPSIIEEFQATDSQGRGVNKPLARPVETTA